MQRAVAASVLVVDDEPQVVWMLRFTLEAEGYQTFSARDGRAGLDGGREHRPNLMLLDIMMPITDGGELTPPLSARRFDPPSAPRSCRPPGMRGQAHRGTRPPSPRCRCGCRRSSRPRTRTGARRCRRTRREP